MHERSAQHVGMDSIILGSWTDTTHCKKILDAGTGCGLLALMCAQKNQTCDIIGVDIDPPSIEEANYNFANSPWKDRMKALLMDFNDLAVHDIDLIISNPPYFDSGVEAGDSARLNARHKGLLSIENILDKASYILSEYGRVSVILPSFQEEEVVEHAKSKRLCLKRAVRIKARPELKSKRIMMEFTRIPKDGYCDGVKEEELIIESSANTPSEQFKALCKDFYLKF